MILDYQQKGPVDLEWLNIKMKKVFYLYKSGEFLRKDYSLVLQEKNGNITYIPIEHPLI